MKTGVKTYVGSNCDKVLSGYVQPFLLLSSCTEYCESVYIMYQSQYFCTYDNKNEFPVYNAIGELRRLEAQAGDENAREKYQSCLSVILQLVYYTCGFTREDFDKLVNPAFFGNSLPLPDVVRDCKNRVIPCDTEIVKNITGSGVNGRISGQRIFELRVNVNRLNLGVRILFFTTDVLKVEQNDYQCYVSIFQKNKSEWKLWNQLTNEHVKIISKVYDDLTDNYADYQHCFDEKWRFV